MCLTLCLYSDSHVHRHGTESHTKLQLATATASRVLMCSCRPTCEPREWEPALRVKCFFQMPLSLVSILPLLAGGLYEFSSGKHRRIKRTLQTTVKERSVACTKTNSSGDLSAKSLSYHSSGSYAPQCVCHFSFCYPNKETRSTGGPNQGITGNRKQPHLRLTEGEASKIPKHKNTLQ